MLLRVSVLRKIGYLDEVMESYAEELDLCWRMQLSGYEQYSIHSSIIYHLGTGSRGKKKLRFKKEFLIHRNHWIALFKNYERKTWFRIMPFKIFLETVAFFGFLFKKPISSAAVLKANIWIATHIYLLNKMNKQTTKIRKINDKEMIRK